MRLIPPALMIAFLCCCCEPDDSGEGQTSGGTELQSECSDNDDCGSGGLCVRVGAVGICQEADENTQPSLETVITEWGTFSSPNCGGVFDICDGTPHPLQVGQCTRVEARASDPEGDPIEFGFWLPTHDFDGGLRYPGEHDLVAQLSGSRSIVELCAFSGTDLGEFRNLWIEVSDDWPYAVPISKANVRFFITD